VKLRVITLGFLLGVVAACAVAMARPPWTPLRIFGIALALPSAVLLSIARWQLSAAFHGSAKPTKLVTTGLYSRVRNPIYLFGGLSIIGAVLYFRQGWLLFVLPVVVPVQIIISRHEAEALAARFGDEYRMYRARTWF
jgi:protein-S-isoprenylcysteine O-methyltransferase Ste14